MSATCGAQAGERAEALASRYVDAVAPDPEAADTLEIQPRARRVLAGGARAVLPVRGLTGEAGDAEVETLCRDPGASVRPARTRALNPRVAA